MSHRHRWGPDEGLRRAGFSRSDLVDRPIRSLEDLRAEKRAIEEHLLALVAFDDDKVDEVNALLDELAFNGADHTQRQHARVEARIEGLHRQARERDTEWVFAKAPDNAVKKAVGRVRSLIISASTSSPPTGKTIDKAVADLYVACERLAEEKRAEAEHHYLD